MMLLREWLRNAEWLYELAENQTCGDLCDKTWEQQGCPVGTCAREDGLHALRKLITKTEIVVSLLMDYEEEQKEETSEDHRN